MDELASKPKKRHVEIAVAADMLAELIDAAVAGERVFLHQDGVPQVQLVVSGREVDAYLDGKWERKLGPEA